MLLLRRGAAAAVRRAAPKPQQLLRRLQPKPQSSQRSLSASAGPSSDALPPQLFVRNLPPDTTADELRLAFEATNAPAVLDVFVPQDGEANWGRGVGVVTLASLEDADAVRMETNGMQIGGRRIAVDLRDESSATRILKHTKAVQLNRDIVSTRTLRELLSFFSRQGEEYNAVNYVTSLHRLSALIREDAPHDDVSGAKSGSLSADDLKRRSIAEGVFKTTPNGDWATSVEQATFRLATLRRRALHLSSWDERQEDLVYRALDHLDAFPDEWGSRELANSVWSMAKLQVHDIERRRKGGFMDVEDTKFDSDVPRPSINDEEDEKKPRKKWGKKRFGEVESTSDTQKWLCKTVLEAVAAHVPAKVALFKSQELAMTAWAYSACVGVNSRKSVFEAIADEAPRKVANLKPHEAATVVWAFSHSKVEAPRLFDAIALDLAASSYKLAEFRASELAPNGVRSGRRLIKTFRETGLSKGCPERSRVNTVWSYAMLGCKSEYVDAAPVAAAVQGDDEGEEADDGNTAEWRKRGNPTMLLFKAISKEIPKHAQKLNPQNLADLTWAYASTGVRSADVFRSVTHHLPKSYDHYASTNEGRAVPAKLMSQTAWAFATASVRAPAVFRCIAQNLQKPDQVKRLLPKEIADLLWSFSKSKFKSGALFTTVTAAAKPQLGKFTLEQLTQVMMACAAMDFESPELFEGIADEATKAHKMKLLSPKLQADLCWAFSEVKFSKDGLSSRSRGVFKEVEDNLPQTISHMDATDLSRLAWAFSMMGIQDKDFFHLLIWASIKKLEAFTPSELARLAWSLATAHCPDVHRVFDLIARRLAKKDDSHLGVSALSTEQLAHTLLSFLMCGIDSPILFATISKELTEDDDRIATSNATDLASLLFAFATAKVKAPELFEKMARVLLQPVFEHAALSLDDAAEASIEKTATGYFADGADAADSAYAADGEAPTETALVRRASSPRPTLLVDRLNFAQLANVAWSFAASGAQCEDGGTAEALFEALTDALAAAASRARIGSLKASDVSNALWGLAAAGVDQSRAEKCFHAMVPHLPAHDKGLDEDLDLEACSQLHQVCIYLEACWPPKRHQGLPHPIVAALAAESQREFRTAHLEFEEDPSVVEREVSASLLRIGWHHLFKHVTREGFPVVIAQRESKIAVCVVEEYEHMVHLDGTPTRDLEGPAKFDERILKATGWSILRVPYYEWTSLRDDDHRDAYLKAKTTGLEYELEVGPLPPGRQQLSDATLLARAASDSAESAKQRGLKMNEGEETRLTEDDAPWVNEDDGADDADYRELGHNDQGQFDEEEALVEQHLGMAYSKYNKGGGDSNFSKNSNYRGSTENVYRGAKSDDDADAEGRYVSPKREPERPAGGNAGRGSYGQKKKVSEDVRDWRDKDKGHGTYGY